jgi:hypothetical protein
MIREAKKDEEVAVIFPLVRPQRRLHCSGFIPACAAPLALLDA